MDMRRHLKHCLTNGDLEQMGGEYEGVISEVIEEVMRNPYTTERQPQPVILFPDGQRLRWPNSRHSLSDVPGTVQTRRSQWICDAI